MERPCLTFGPFRLDCANGILLRDGEPLSVGRRAINVLHALLQRPGEVLTKRQLMDAAWPDVTVEEANLHVQIASLRKVLGPAPGGGEWIATVPRVGYRLVPSAVTLYGESTASGPVPRWLSRLRPRLPLWTAATMALAVAAGIAFAAFRAEEIVPGNDATMNPSLAVLPFVDMTGNPDLAYFGEGVRRDLVAMLTRVPNLTVVALTSGAGEKGDTIDLREVGAELGATHVLEGSVRKDADRIRIVAQLVDARTGQHMWADRFDRTDADPLALQDEVTRRIVAALAGTAGTLALQQYREAWGKDSASLAEYDYVLRALSRIAIGTPEAADRADTVLQEGLSRFPASSLLKAQAASTVMWRFARGWNDAEDPLEDIRRAGELARHALDDPSGSPMMRLGAHIALAYAHLAQGRFDQAVVEAEAAIALSPYDGRIVYYVAEIPIIAGRPERALEWIERAASLYLPDDPRQQELASMRAYALLKADGPAAALEVLDTIRTSDAIVLRSTYLLRAVALVFLDRLDEAKAQIAMLREHDPAWTLTRHRRRFFYSEPGSLEAAIQALHLAGLPER